MTYLWAPKGASAKLAISDLPADIGYHVKQVVKEADVKAGLNVIGRMAITKDSDVGKMLSAVGAYKDALPLVGKLSPKVFQKGDTAQTKNDILDNLDIKLPLKVSGLHLPSQVQLKETNLEIKGTKDKAGKRGIETVVAGAMDAKVHNETLKFDYAVDIKKQPGKPAQVSINGKTEPGTKLSISLVETFTLTDMAFKMVEDKGKWQWSVDARSTLNNQPVEVTYGLYANKQPSLTFNTKMTIADLVGQKNLPGLDDVELDTVMTRPGMWFLHGKVKGQDTYFQIQKIGSKHLIAAYLYSMPLTELIPGSKNSPLKDAKFSNVVALYYPGSKPAKVSATGLTYDAGDWVYQSNKQNPIVKPGLNVFGYIDIHPSGELATLLKEVGVTELKLPLNGGFSPKAFGGNLSSIKNEILENLDIKVPLPALKMPGASKLADIKHATLTVTGVKEKGASALDVGIKGGLDVKIASENASFDFDLEIMKPKGKPSYIQLTAEEKKGTKLTIDLLEKFTLTNLKLDMNNELGHWLWYVTGDTTLRNKPVEFVYNHTAGQSPFMEITTKVNLADVVASPGLPGLDDVELDSVTIFNKYVDIKMKVKGVDSTVMAYKQPGISKPMLAFLTGNFSPAEFVPGAEDTPLKDAQFNGLTFIYNPVGQPTRFDNSSVPAVGSWLKNIAKVSSPTLKPGLNVFGALIVHPEGEMKSLLKSVGVNAVNIPLDGSLSPKAFAANSASIKAELLDKLDIKVDLPKLRIGEVLNLLGIW